MDLSDADLKSSELARYFPATELSSIGDEIADGLWSTRHPEERPLTLFDALRTDFSLARLAHYTGSAAGDVQAYVLFTNYHRYVDEFIRWGAAQLADGATPYASLHCPGVSSSPRIPPIRSAPPPKARGDATRCLPTILSHPTGEG